MQKIYPCIWLNDRADEAAKFYVSLFEKSKIVFTSFYGKAGAEISGQKEGSVLTVDMEIEGMQIQLLNGGPHFKLNPSTSMYVWCKTEKEIDKLWKRLSDQGAVLFELQKYPWAEKYGWCTDRFGLSWQVMIGDGPAKIAPALLFTGKAFGKAEKAVNFYLSQFKNSKLEFMHKDPTTNAVLHSVFKLDGVPFVLMEGPAKGKSDMTLNGAMSFAVNCKDQKEIDLYWESIKRKGSPENCGWIEDDFGVSWQIVPAVLSEMLKSPDTKKIESMMNAMFKMEKLEIEVLKTAFDKG
tara:strand:+ start:18898 stop:19782 length:885 start_codon:yes stop_codon:yes gene_type:complete